VTKNRVIQMRVPVTTCGMRPAVRDRASRRGFSLIEMLVVVTIIGIVLAISLPAISRSRQAARGAECRNNLKQIGIALQSHHSRQEVLPEDGRNGWGFGAFLLPDLEQIPLFEALTPPQRTLASIGPATLDGTGADLKVFYCEMGPKGSASGGFGRSTYRGNTDLLGRELQLTDVLDGESTTVAVGEVLDEHAWARPGTAALQGVPNSGPFASNHTGGANFVFCDGAARFISENVDQQTFQAIGTINGSDVPGEY